MKKTLFFLLMAGVVGSVEAQNAPQQSSKVVKAVNLLPPYYSAKAEKVSAANSPAVVKSVHHARHNAQLAANKVYVGSAQNILGIITAECTQVDVNESLNMISFTHRESAGLNFGTGVYQTDYSTDGGTTWDTAKALVFKGDSASAAGVRYPNGVILNPSGNTNASQAFAVTSGPHTNGSSWDSTVFGSVRFDGSHVSQYETVMYPNVNSERLNVFSPPHFMQTTDDSVIHSVEEAWTLDASSTNFYGYYGAVINTGTWSGATNSVTWTKTVIRPHFVSGAGLGAPVDSEADISATAMAWSQDGSVGYVVFFGDLDSTGYNYASYQPIVYKSTDHGATWNMMPLYNFANIPNLVKYLKPAIDSNVRLPFWDINGDSAGYYTGHDVDVTVDMNNNLHIFGVIESGAIANPDSSGYTYYPFEAPGRYLYDVYTTSASGGWQATFLDSLICPEGIDVNETQWNGSEGAFTWGARVQASRTTDGSKVFCTWLDDANSGDEQMISPDIYTIGIDVTNGTKTPPTRITTDGENYFTQVSDIVLPNGSCWNIPVVEMVDPAGSSSGLNPIEFYYVPGVTLCSSDFTTGVGTISGSTGSGFSVSPNYPNPFNNTTQFNIGMTKENLVSVDVFNVFGQKVYSIPAQQMPAGNHLMTINANGWSSGVYFFRVTVGDETKTQKMVVQ